LGCSRESLLWLRRLTEFDSSGQELPAPSDDSGVLYTHLRSAVFDLLDAVSEERCLLVVVEDLQWLDRASARLFAEILDWILSRKIFFLFNSREAHNPFTEAIGHHGITRLHLDPLGDPDATTLVRTLISASGGSPEGESVAWLIDTCDGN